MPELCRFYGIIIRMFWEDIHRHTSMRLTEIKKRW